MNTPMSNLPSEILTEILLRLPLRSLVVAKCVCKTFLSLISPNNPDFIYRHSAKATPVLVFQFLRWDKHDVVQGLPKHFLSPSIEDSALQLPDYRHYMQVGENTYCLVNSCNALLYLVRCNKYRKDSIICNPVTNEYLMIPHAEVGFTERAASMRLGFCRASDRYKVLKLVRFYNRNWKSMLSAKVLTVGSNSSWRDVENAIVLHDEYTFVLHACYAVLDGIICWVYDYSENIDFFDFEREGFGAIEIPRNDSPSSMVFSKSVGVIRGCLCYGYCCYSANQVVVWVLRSSGDGSPNWSKEFEIDMMGKWPDRRWVMPMQVLKDGEILMFTGTSHVVFYDTENKESRRVAFQSYGETRRDPIFAVDLMPSFVPLKDVLKLQT